MKSNRINTTIIVILFFTVFNLSAGNIEFGIYGGLSIPTADFADDNIYEDKAGFALKGFGLGIEMNKPLNSSSLYWSSSVSFLINSYNTDEIEDYYRDDLQYYPNVYKCKVDAGFWGNIPLLTGIKFQTKISPTLEFFGLGQIGINIVNHPDLDIELDFGDYYGYYYEVRSTINFDSATTFAFMVGGGVSLNKKLNISFKYFGLGKAELKGESNSENKSYIDGEIAFIDTYENDIEKDQSISIFLLSLGFNF